MPKMRVEFSAEVDEAYDTVPDAVADWTDVVTGLIEKDRGPDIRVRTRAWTQPPRYGVLATIGGEEWLILWTPMPDGVALMTYLGPNTLTG